MRVDAHQHYWRIDRGDYGWITPDIPVLYRDFLPEDLESHRERHGLDGTIVVQAAPTLAETDYLLSLAERSPSILGVVGYLDLHDPRHADHYERFSQHPKFVGFRIMIQEMADARAILETDYVRALAHYARLGIPVDLLVKSAQLDALVELIRLVPRLHAVIDHIAKPNIRDGKMEPWASHMRELASYPNLYCKLSGMVTEADHREWQPAHFVPYVRHIAETFGPDRVLFGSDWPVCLLAADYDQVVEVLEHALPPTWGEVERAKLYGGNAKAFYRL